MKSKLISLILLFISLYCFSQSNISYELDTNYNSVEEKIESINKGVVRYFNSDPTFANKALERAIELNSEIENDTLKAETYKTIGYVQFLLGNFDKSLEYFDESYKYYLKINDSLNLAFVLNSKGSNYVDKGKSDKALESFIKAEKIYLNLLKTKPDDELINIHLGVFYINFGLFYNQEINDREKALEAFNKALNIAKNINDSIRIAAAYSNIGMIYNDNDNQIKSREYFEKAYLITAKHGNQPFSARILHNIGETYKDEQNYEKAKEYFFKSLGIIERINNQKDLAKTNRIIASIFYETKEYDKALKYLRTSEKHAANAKLDKQLVEIYNLMYQTFDTINQTDSALKYYIKKTEIFDELRNTESSKRLENLQIKYETEKHKNEIELLKYENQKKKLENTLLILLIVLIIIIAVFLIFVFINRNKALKKEQELIETKSNALQQKLEFKNRELTSNALSLAKLNEITANIAEKVSKAMPHSDKKGKEIISSIIKELELNVNDSSWKEFEMRFENVYSGFYKKIKDINPDISPNELKICALLRLNLSTKDVAALTSRSPRTIDSVRFSIRKKLNLDSNENLNTFLSNL